MVVTNGGQFAYTSNTASDTLSGFAISSDGRLRLLNADGVTANTGAGSGPIDMAFSRGSKFLYSLNGGNGSIGAFRVGHKGQLTPLGDLFGLLRERFIARLLKAPPADLPDPAGTAFDVDKALRIMMRNEKPGGHGDRAHAVAAVELALWDLNAKLAGVPAW